MTSARAAGDRAALDADEARGDALTGLGALDRLGRAPRRERTRTSSPPGSSASRSPAATSPDHSVPVTTVPMPRSVKARSIGQPRRAARRGRGTTAAAARSSASRSSSRPAPVRAEVSTIAAPASAVPASSSSTSARASSAVSASTRSRLRQRDDGSAHAEQLEDRDVLARLRHHAVVAGDDEQREVDAGRAGDHRAHEALVPRHVDDRERAARRAREVRIAERDGDAARLLLRQAVGVDAGERAHERRLAVIDVPGGAELRVGASFIPER